MNNFNKENENEKEKEISENEKYIKELLPQIIEKGVELLNETGNKIQFFKKQLKQIDESLQKDENIKKIKNNLDEINYIREKLGKKMISDLLNKEKEIFLNLSFINKLFPSFSNIPEKLFNTNVFLEICFIDLINSHNKFLDMDISGQLIISQYQKYENKSNEFLISKKKYLIPLLKLSITMLDTSLENNNKENNLNIFDLKKYVKNLLNFIDKMINNDSVFDNNIKLSIMPGLISKITKLIESKIKVTTKMLEKIFGIENKYINILFNKENDDINNNLNLNKKKFCEFYEIFILILFDKYKNKISGIILENLIKMNIKYITYLNNNKYINYIGVQFFENIFYLINNQIFEELHNNIINNNSIYDKLENYNSYDEIYITYIKCSLFNIENKNKKLNELMNIIENAFIKKEFIKFNKNLIEFLGIFKLILYYNKINNINNNNNTELFNNIFSFFGKILKINKNKIIFEVINSYEFIFLNINNTICKTNIISEFFKSVLNTYNNEYKLHLLFIYLSSIYQIFPEFYSFLFNISLNHVIETTKKFNNKLIKKKFTTYTQLNESFNEVLNSFIIFEFLIIFQKKRKNLEKNDTKKIISLINFFYDLFIDTDNEENFNKAKITEIKLSLINLFIMNLSIFIIEINNEYMIDQKNRLILLSMFNYSNNAKIIKYSSSLLILNINKDKDLKNFIKNNYTFLINSILNKIIYFNIDNNFSEKKISIISQQKKNNNYFHLRNIILNVFSSLIELINNFYFDEEINKIFVLEFYNYIQKLFPYFDNNIKDKNANVIDIMLEIFIKISFFQKNVLYNECKKNNIDIKKLNIDIIRMTSEEFFDEKIDKEYNIKNELIIKIKKLKENLKLQKCNICRKLILRFLPLILSKNIIFISKSFQILKNYILMLFLLPMEKEEEENFSEEDPSNVIISSSLGPIMYELWLPIIYSFQRNLINLSLFNNFFDIFEEIANFYPEFFDGEKVFKYLLPCLKEKIEFFLKEYKEGQIFNCFFGLFNFLKKIFSKNKYNKKYQDEFRKFLDEYKKYFIMGCDDNKKNIIEKNISQMMLCFTKE